MVQELSVKADTPSSFHFRRYIRSLAGIAAIGIGVFRFEFAGNAQLFDPVANLLRTAPVRLSVVLRHVNTESVDQVSVYQRVLAGYFRRRTPCDLASNPTCLNYSYRQTGSRQQIGCGEAYNS